MSIPKFDKTDRQIPGKNSNWPDSENRKEGVFEGRKAYRKLVVMIDNELFDESDVSEMSRPNKSILLKSLLYHELVEFYKYAYDFTPSNIEQIIHKSIYKQDPAYPGYIILYPKRHNDFWPATYSQNPTSITYGTVTGNLIDIAKDDESDSTYTLEDAADKREQDILALQAASQCLGADIYITERPYLYNGSGITLGRGVTVLHPDEAIPLISLYLRAQQEFLIPTGQEKFTMSFNRGLFYWVGARELLPEAWRWFSACVYHSAGIKDDKLSYLGGATLSRMQRAIELRDQVHIAINMSTNNDTNDLALTNFDGVLLSLMGSVDATARVAHNVLGLPVEKVYNAGWQRKEWLNTVAKVSPALKNIVKEPTMNYYILRVLSLLRNSIHGEPIHAITKQDTRKKEIILALPANEESEILKAMDATGGRESWGVKQLTTNLNEIDPGILIDKLIIEVAELLNEIMKTTPVETLSNIENADLSFGARTNNDRDSFSEWNRVNIRWQLGF